MKEAIIIQILFIIVLAIILKIRLDQNDNIRLNHKTLSRLNSLQIRIEALERQQSAGLDNPTPNPKQYLELSETAKAHMLKELRDQQDWSREREDI